MGSVSDMLDPYVEQPGVGGTGFSASLTPDAFNQMITDKSSFSLAIDSGTRNAIQWIRAKDRILIGTTGGEWRLSGHSNKPLTPTNYDLKPQTRWGSKDMQPLVLHESIAFVDYVGKKLRELVWDGTDERYLSPDLMMLAEHITLSGGITSMAYQKNPDSIIWATLADGTLISCTYDKGQDVVAWARHPMSEGLATTATDGSEYVPTAVYPTLRATTNQTDPGLVHNVPIHNITELQEMANDKTANYYLTNDIDASVTSTWNVGAGFVPIDTFTGTFDGCGYTISNLFINLNEDTTGLFGKVSGAAKIANVTLADVDITGRDQTGALVGDFYTTVAGGLIQNCHSTGTITAYAADSSTEIGGLVGRMGYNVFNTDFDMSLYDCSSTCTIDISGSGAATGNVGGLIGYSRFCTISNSFATGSITNILATRLGGFIGYVEKDCQISYCHATGNVSGKQVCGGFAGQIYEDTDNIIRCYATGNATSVDNWAGGFVGLSNAVTVTDCYAWGNATATQSCGGFVGSAQKSNTTTDYDNCYSIGVVTGVQDASTGGFCGTDGIGIDGSSNYWDTDTSGDLTSGTLLNEVGKTTTEMKTESTFTNWDFDDIWTMGTPVKWVDDPTSNIGANSVCVIPGSTEDEVWLTVGRVINGSIVRYIERMKPRVWGTDQADCFFVDSGLTYDGDATDTFTGLDHLEGETVAILGDGAVFPTQTVSGGSITLTDSVSVCHIGLPYTYKLKPMRMDQGYNGTSKGSIKKITEVVISFYKTLNARYGDGTHTYDINWRETSAEYTTPPDLVTGDKVVVADGGFSVEDPIQIEGSDPLPCTVRAIIPRIEVTGR